MAHKHKIEEVHARDEYHNNDQPYAIAFSFNLTRIFSSTIHQHLLEVIAVVMKKLVWVESQR